MFLFSYWRKRKERLAREKLLKETPHMERIMIFTFPEFVSYCDRNNAYVFCLARAIDILMCQNKEKFDEERLSFNKATVESFTRMVSHSFNQVRVPLPMGCDPKIMKPHPLERGRINRRVYDGLTAMKQILDPSCSTCVARVLADRYITDPYTNSEATDEQVTEDH